MPRLSTLQLAKDKIRFVLNEDYRTVFSSRDLNLILKKNFYYWDLAASTKLNRFIHFLTEEDLLKKTSILNKERFVKKNYSNYEIIQSIKPNLFFSHYSALRIHSLTEQVPNDVYVSSKKTVYNYNSDKLLTQSAIDDAFNKPARKKERTGVYKNKNIYLLENVVSDIDIIDFEINSPNRQISIRVTNLEKTLIDAAIRPYYCGGIFEVIKAYELAKERISVNKILAIINRNQYKYPYAQNIGFYLEYAGYSGSQIKRIKDKISIYDFYLDHNIPNKSYSKEWKIYYPSYL